MHRFKMVLMVMITMAWGANAIGDNVSVNYPTDYRSWQHVKTMIIQPGHPLEDPFGGIHHIYANPKAMAGLSSGTYEDGAGFVFDLLAYAQSNQTIVETDRIRIDVMQYDREKFSETGGWGFETFVGDSSSQRLDQDVVVSCYNCHIPAEAANYVYSRYRP